MIVSCQMKKKMREVIRTRISRLSPSSRQKFSRSIIENLLESDLLNKGELIGVYASQDPEVETEELIELLYKLEKRVFLPRIKGEEMHFHEVKKGGVLILNKYKILEPLENAPSQDNLDILIMPCVAADKTGNRLGRGGGFYDRFLEKNNPLYTICLCFEKQIIKQVPCNSHDKAVDIVITEARVIISNKSKLAKLINGNKIANSLLHQSRFLIKKNNLSLSLAILLIGKDPASHLYVKKKMEACTKTGITARLFSFSEEALLEEIENLIDALNQDPAITGILIQLPLPPSLLSHTQYILDRVAPFKDIDGLGSEQQRLLMAEKKGLVSCTPLGILNLLKALNIPLRKQKICLVGHGKLVNKPLAILLKNLGAAPIICDKSTPNIAEKTVLADIIISATGVPHLLNSSFIKEGAIVIDAGSGQLNGKTCGDCNTSEMVKKAKFITPVPGGVGPITIATLTQNLLAAFQLQHPFHKIGLTINSIAIVTSSSSWFLPYAHELKDILKKQYFNVQVYTSLEQINQGFDVVFVLSYFEKLPASFLVQHSLCLIAHEGKLPEIRGWAPLFWQILKQRSLIHISLIIATEDKSSGDIVITKKIRLSGTELYEELRKKQADAIIDLCLSFLKESPANPIPHPKVQLGAASIYRRRNPKDSELDINKPLKSLFKQLRVANNEEFPAFFYYKNKKYILRIFQESDPSKGS